MPDGQTLATAASGSKDNRLHDRRFLRQLNFLCALRDFLMQEGVAVPQQGDLLEFEGLNALRGTWIIGRRASVDEWNLVEHKIGCLLALLNEQQRRRFRLSRTTKFLLVVPVILVFAAALALACSVSLSAIPAPPALTVIPTQAHFLAFLVWVASLGGIGGAAFIYVNALSIQIDPSVDVVNHGFIAMRMLLGGLFGLVLTLPYGYHDFLLFCVQLKLGGTTEEFRQPALLLMPFILGFSTPLVLALLNRGIDSIQILFGIKSAVSTGGKDAKPGLAGQP